MIAFLVLETLMIGVFCALDLVLFYLFFEGGLIPMFLIIGVWGGERRVYASFKFFLYTLLGSVLMLLAIIYMYWDAGTTDIFGADGGRQVRRRCRTWLWLGLLGIVRGQDADVAGAHLAAGRPRRGADRGLVILAGVLLKMGGYGFLRFSIPMFPTPARTCTPLVFAMSHVAIIYTSLVALMQEDMKKLDRLFLGCAYGLRDHGHLHASMCRASRAASSRCCRHGLVSAALFLCRRCGL